MKKVLLTVAFLTLAGHAFSQPAREVVRLRWAGPPGSRPGTYQEWMVKHPVKKFESQRIKTSTNRNAKGPGAAIIIESGMYSLVADKIDTLMEYLNQDGYSVYLYTASGGSPESLKALLRGINDSVGLEGALLIGDLPVAWFETNNDFGEGNYVQWPMDLYYMDLDGDWRDTLGGVQNGIYDGHSGSMGPEISIGRLIFTGVNNSGVVLENYLNKDISYRRQINNPPPRALVFVDDDWIPWAQEWAGNVAMIYKDTANYWNSDTTTAEIYTEKLKNPQAWVSVFVHSSPLLHQFVSQGYSYYYGSYYNTQDPPANFYNHFACSFARYTEDQCGSVMSIVNQSHGLGAIGSTKTGSMLDFHYFYGPLGQGKSIGQAHKSWFASEIADGIDIYDLSWFYGTILLGDPFLKPLNAECYLYFFSPQGGELFDESDTVKIKWLRFGTKAVHHYGLRYSTDGGATYPETLATGISGNLDGYQWPGPALNSPAVKLKLEAYDSIGSLLGETQSDGNFTVDTQAPAECQAIYPGHNSVIGTYSPCFAWVPAYDACGVKEYRVQCAADEEFYFMDFDTTVCDTVLQTDLYLEDTYYWRIQAIDLAGHIGNWNPTSIFTVDPSGITAEKPGERGAPVSFGAQNYPNPAGPEVTFKYQLPAAATVRLEIFDISGRLLRREDLGLKQAGRHAYSWKAGRSAPGVYFYRIAAGKDRKTGRMVLVK